MRNSASRFSFHTFEVPRRTVLSDVAEDISQTSMEVALFFVILLIAYLFTAHSNIVQSRINAQTLKAALSNMRPRAASTSWDLLVTDFTVISMSSSISCSAQMQNRGKKEQKSCFRLNGVKYNLSEQRTLFTAFEMLAVPRSDMFWLIR